MSVDPPIFHTVAEGDDFQAALDSAVRIVFARYRPYVERDDLRQEGWLWAHAKAETKLRELCEHSRPANRERMIRNALCNYLAEYARREKAQKVGYKPEDEVFYTMAGLSALMPDVYDYESRAPKGSLAGELLSGGGDPAEGGSFMATLADISSALGRLSVEDQRVLFLRFGTRDSDEAIGLALGCETVTVRSKVHRALGRLRKELGGPQPDVDREYIGSRRVLTNAAAQAITGE